jgi:hypothetical protein
MSNLLDGLRINTDIASDMPIVHPVTKQPVVDATGSPAFIRLTPFESPAGRALDRKQQDENLKRGRAITRDENEAAFVEKLVAITKDWHLVNLGSGEAMGVSCTPDMARAIYPDDGFLWLKSQVVIYAADLGNFPGVVPTV